MNAPPGFRPPQILNPYVFADLSQPERHRYPGSVVYQSGPPAIRDPYLDAVVEALDGDAPTGGGTFVGGHLAPGSLLLGNYLDRADRGGQATRGDSFVVPFSSIGVDDTQAESVLSLLRNRLRHSTLLGLDSIGWGQGDHENVIFARVTVRLRGADPGQVRLELARAAQYVNTRIGGGSIQVGGPLAQGVEAVGAITASPELGDQLVQALFSERPDELILQSPVRAPMWWERTYLGVPIWALAGLGVFVAGTAGWWWRRQQRRRTARNPSRRRRRRAR